MRAGSSTIQQTLTPEAAAVLNHSIAESARRNHGQTTPLHVAAALLSSPSGYLRQACIRSHPHSSHPLQCRALELCFSVALDRLPSALPAPGMEPEPPISNALMAALKRAQAHQRRGCPDQQQHPLLAVKVELDQLIVSILDDPGVSRVMREAGFSSPAVKAAIEQSLTSPSHNSNHHHGHIAPRLCYLNHGGPNANMGKMRDEEIIKSLEIMMRSRKRNPILVGDFSEPESIVRELLRKIESDQELRNDGFFENVQVISMDKNSFFLPSKIKELGDLVESVIGIGGVILDLGDLRWLVEHQHQQQEITERRRAVVAEMAELLARFNNTNSNNVWLIGTANCETYLRCQVYYSTMECDWDLQAVPLASRPGIYPRLGTERFSRNPLEPLNPARALQTSPPSLAWRVLTENGGSCQRTVALFCPQCSGNYEKEFSKLEDIEKSFSESKKESTRPSLPQWLQNVKLNANEIVDKPPEKNHRIISEQKTKELQKKWRDSCLHLHPSFHQISCADRLSLPATVSMTSLYNPNLLTIPLIQPQQLNTNNKVNAQLTDSPPLECPVQTDLVLGRKGADDKFVVDHHQAKDFLGCISSDKLATGLDADTYKNLRKRLMEKAWWQAEAASSVASAVARCRLGNGKRRGSRGDVWLLFAGPDRAGKEKMVSTLAELLCGARPITVFLSGSGESVRGRTTVDRIAEVVRKNPSSVIMMDGMDEAGEFVQGSIKRAIEGGRITDSYGHEVSIGNVVFVLTGDWSSTNSRGVSRDCEIASIGSGGWKLGLVVGEKNTKKRRTNWSGDEDDRPMRSRSDVGSGVSFDLNLGLSMEDGRDRTEGSRNSSDLTIDHEEFLITLVPHDLLDSVDESIVFKPFDSGFVIQEIKKTMFMRFWAIAGDENSSLEVGDEVLEKILGGLLHDQTSLEEWVERVLAPSFDQIKTLIPSDERSGYVVRLVVESDLELSSAGKTKVGGDWLPSSILV